ncbi:MAG: lysophospholipid acyltransferase family protein [Candidatus Hatepunaea meridiana]|nr:lysophospholipid acyltransferase family protein [Candidatus Hatepunaea meridiana]
MSDIGNGNNFIPENPGFFNRALSYLFINFGIVPSISVFMHLLNRTRITGKKNLVRLKPPYILMSNHLTLLDNLFIGPLIFWPKGFNGYRYLPYHAPEENNFYKKWLIVKFMKIVKSIPVIRGRGIRQEGVTRMITAVKNGGILHIFPEGTRTRNGQIGKAKDTIARIVYESGAPVVPLYHQGLEKVLPIGSGVPKVCKTINIAIGEPIIFDNELKEKNNPQTWKVITQRIMDGIREQQVIVNERWGEISAKI